MRSSWTSSVTCFYRCHDHEKSWEAGEGGEAVPFGLKLAPRSWHQQVCEQVDRAGIRGHRGAGIYWSS